MNGHINGHESWTRIIVMHIIIVIFVNIDVGNDNNDEKSKEK